LKGWGKMKVKMLIDKRVSLKKDNIYKARERDERSFWVKDKKGDEWVVIKKHIEIIEKASQK
jgi:hypothetical protein